MKQQLRDLRNMLLRRRLKNHDFTIIANNCIAGCVLHDLKHRFDTPTVNLYIPFPDYIVFLQNLRTFVYADFEELPNEDGCPKGLLGGVIRVFFLHYASYNEGVKVWKKRAERIHWDNIFVVLSEKDGCTIENLQEFEQLTFYNKVALTHLEYPKLTCGFHIKGYEHGHELGNIMDFKGGLGAKVYDQFDWVTFLNRKKSDEIINRSTCL